MTLPSPLHNTAVPPLPVKLVAATAISATALAITTIALTVLLHLYPQMGVASFSTITAAAGLSFVAFVISCCLVHRKRDAQLAFIQPAPPISLFCPVVTHPHIHAHESTQIETLRAALPDDYPDADARTQPNHTTLLPLDR